MLEKLRYPIVGAEQPAQGEVLFCHQVFVKNVHLAPNKKGTGRNLTVVLSDIQEDDLGREREYPLNIPVGPEASNNSYSALELRGKAQLSGLCWAMGISTLDHYGELVFPRGQGHFLVTLVKVSGYWELVKANPINHKILYDSFVGEN